MARRYGVVSCVLLVAASVWGAQPERLAQLWGGDHWLSRAGIDWSFVYMAELSAKVTGPGVRPGADLRGDASLYMTLDTAAAKLWPGGQVVLHVQSQHGATASDRLGDYHCLSNITGGDFVQLAQLYYRHDFAGGHWLKIGKQEGNDDFAGSEYTSCCLNSSAAFMPLMPLPSSPDQAWGITAGLRTSPHTSVNLGAFRDKYGHQPVYFAQPNLSYQISSHPGNVSAGWWWDTNDYASVNTVTPLTYRGSYGYYLTFDQELARATSAEDDPRGVGLFGHFAWAPRDRSAARTGWAVGAEWTGPLPGRPDDRFAAAIYQVGFDQRTGFPYSTETAIEALYSAQALPWLVVKGSVQYITHPGGTGPEAVVLGTRVETTF